MKKLITGGKGPERQNYIINYLERELNNNDINSIVIYDATYYLVKYSHNSKVKYFSVDTVLSYLNELGNIKDNSVIIADCYAGLMYSKTNIDKYLELFNNQNIDILLSSRHRDFVPEILLNRIDEIIEIEDYITPLANTK